MHDSIKDENHLLVLGQAGTGKTYFITNLMIEDIENGTGFICFDGFGEIKKFLEDNNYLKDKEYFYVSESSQLESIDFDYIINNNKIIFINSQLDEELKKYIQEEIIKTMNKRADIEYDERQFYNIYMDKIVGLVNEKLDFLISEGRKYKFKLILSLQFIDQLNNYEVELEDIVLYLFKNKVIFKISNSDIKKLKIVVDNMFDELINSLNSGSICFFDEGGNKQTIKTY